MPNPLYNNLVKQGAIDNLSEQEFENNLLDPNKRQALYTNLQKMGLIDNLEAEEFDRLTVNSISPDLKKKVSEYNQQRKKWDAEQAKTGRQLKTKEDIETANKDFWYDNQANFIEKTASNITDLVKTVGNFIKDSATDIATSPWQSTKYLGKSILSQTAQTVKELEVMGLQLANETINNPKGIIGNLAFNVIGTPIAKEIAQSLQDPTGKDYNKNKKTINKASVKVGNQIENFSNDLINVDPKFEQSAGGQTIQGIGSTVSAALITLATGGASAPYQAAGMVGRFAIALPGNMATGRAFMTQDVVKEKIDYYNKKGLKLTINDITNPDPNKMNDAKYKNALLDIDGAIGNAQLYGSITGATEGLYSPLELMKAVPGASKIANNVTKEVVKDIAEKGTKFTFTNGMDIVKNIAKLEGKNVSKATVKKIALEEGKEIIKSKPFLHTVYNAGKEIGKQTAFEMSQEAGQSIGESIAKQNIVNYDHNTNEYDKDFKFDYGKMLQEGGQGALSAMTSTMFMKTGHAGLNGIVKSVKDVDSNPKMTVQAEAMLINNIAFNNKEVNNKLKSYADDLVSKGVPKEKGMELINKERYRLANEHYKGLVDNYTRPGGEMLQFNYASSNATPEDIANIKDVVTKKGITDLFAINTLLGMQTIGEIGNKKNNSIEAVKSFSDEMNKKSSNDESFQEAKTLIAKETGLVGDALNDATHTILLNTPGIKTAFKIAHGEENSSKLSSFFNNDTKLNQVFNKTISVVKEQNDKLEKSLEMLNKILDETDSNDLVKLQNINTEINNTEKEINDNNVLIEKHKNINEKISNVTSKNSQNKYYVNANILNGLNDNQLDKISENLDPNEANQFQKEIDNTLSMVKILKLMPNIHGIYAVNMINSVGKFVSNKQKENTNDIEKEVNIANNKKEETKQKPIEQIEKEKEAPKVKTEEVKTKLKKEINETKTSIPKDQTEIDVSLGLQLQAEAKAIVDELKLKNNDLIDKKEKVVQEKLTKAEDSSLDEIIKEIDNELAKNQEQIDKKVELPKTESEQKVETISNNIDNVVDEMTVDQMAKDLWESRNGIDAQNDFDEQYSSDPEALFMETSYFNPEDKELKKGALVEDIEGVKFLYLSTNNAGFTQLLTIDGKKVNGPKDINKLKVLGNFKVGIFNNNEFIITNKNIYSTKTGDIVKYNETIKEKIRNSIKQDIVENDNIQEIANSLTEALSKPNITQEEVIKELDKVGPIKPIIKSIADVKMEYPTNTQTATELIKNSFDTDFDDNNPEHTNTLGTMNDMLLALRKEIERLNKDETLLNPYTLQIVKITDSVIRLENGKEYAMGNKRGAFLIQNDNTIKVVINMTHPENLMHNGIIQPLMHEFTHALTSLKLRENGEFASQVYAVVNDMINDMASKGINIDKYKMTDTNSRYVIAMEVLAEVFSTDENISSKSVVANFAINNNYTKSGSKYITKLLDLLRSLFNWTNPTYKNTFDAIMQLHFISLNSSPELKQSIINSEQMSQKLQQTKSLKQISAKKLDVNDNIIDSEQDYNSLGKIDASKNTWNTTGTINLIKKMFPKDTYEVGLSAMQDMTEEKLIETMSNNYEIRTGIENAMLENNYQGSFAEYMEDFIIGQRNKIHSITKVERVSLDLGIDRLNEFTDDVYVDQYGKIKPNLDSTTDIVEAQNHIQDLLGEKNAKVVLLDTIEGQSASEWFTSLYPALGMDDNGDKVIVPVDKLISRMYQQARDKNLIVLGLWGASGRVYAVKVENSKMIKDSKFEKVKQAYQEILGANVIISEGEILRAYLHDLQLGATFDEENNFKSMIYSPEYKGTQDVLKIFKRIPLVSEKTKSFDSTKNRTKIEISLKNNTDFDNNHGIVFKDNKALARTIILDDVLSKVLPEERKQYEFMHLGKTYNMVDILTTAFKGTEIDGALIYLNGGFDTAYNVYQGSDYEGAKKLWVGHDIINTKDGFNEPIYMKCAAHGYSPNSLIGSWMKKNNIAIIASASATKINNTGKMTSASSLVPQYDINGRMVNNKINDNEILEIPLTNFHKITEKGLDHTQGRGASQTFSANQMCSGMPFLKGYEDRFQAIKKEMMNNIASSINSKINSTTLNDILLDLRDKYGTNTDGYTETAARTMYNLLGDTKKAIIKTQNDIVNIVGKDKELFAYAKEKNEQLKQTIKDNISDTEKSAKMELIDELKNHRLKLLQVQSSNDITRSSNIANLFYDSYFTKLIDDNYKKSIDNGLELEMPGSYFCTRPDLGVLDSQQFDAITNNIKMNNQYFELSEEEQAKSKYKFDRKINIEDVIDEATGKLKNGYTVVSADIKEFGVKLFDKIIYYAVPSDSATSTQGVTVVAFGTPTRGMNKRTITLSSSHLMDIIGKDFDIDAIFISTNSGSLLSKESFNELADMFFDISNKYQKHYISTISKILSPIQINSCLGQDSNREIQTSDYYNMKVRAMFMQKLLGKNEDFDSIPKNLLTEQTKAFSLYKKKVGPVVATRKLLTTMNNLKLKFNFFIMDNGYKTLMKNLTDEEYALWDVMCNIATNDTVDIPNNMNTAEYDVTKLLPYTIYDADTDKKLPIVFYTDLAKNITKANDVIKYLFDDIQKLNSDKSFSISEKKVRKFPDIVNTIGKYKILKQILNTVGKDKKVKIEQLLTNFPPIGFKEKSIVNEKFVGNIIERFSVGNKQMFDNYFLDNIVSELNLNLMKPIINNKITDKAYENISDFFGKDLPIRIGNITKEEYDKLFNAEQEAKDAIVKAGKEYNNKFANKTLTDKILNKQLDNIIPESEDKKHKIDSINQNLSDVIAKNYLSIPNNPYEIKAVLKETIDLIPLLKNLDPKFLFEIGSAKSYESGLFSVCSRNKVSEIVDEKVETKAVVATMKKMSISIDAIDVSLTIKQAKVDNNGNFIYKNGVIETEETTINAKDLDTQEGKQFVDMCSEAKNLLLSDEPQKGLAVYSSPTGNFEKKGDGIYNTLAKKIESFIQADPMMKDNPNNDVLKPIIPYGSYVNATLPKGQIADKFVSLLASTDLAKLKGIKNLLVSKGQTIDEMVNKINEILEENKDIDKEKLFTALWSYLGSTSKDIYTGNMEIGGFYKNGAGTLYDILSKLNTTQSAAIANIMVDKFVNNIDGKTSYAGITNISKAIDNNTISEILFMQDNPDEEFYNYDDTFTDVSNTDKIVQSVSDLFSSNQGIMFNTEKMFSEVNFTQVNIMTSLKETHNIFEIAKARQIVDFGDKNFEINKRLENKNLSTKQKEKLIAQRELYRKIVDKHKSQKVSFTEVMIYRMERLNEAKNSYIEETSQKVKSIFGKLSTILDSTGAFNEITDVKGDEIDKATKLNLITGMIHDVIQNELDLKVGLNEDEQVVYSYTNRDNIIEPILASNFDTFWSKLPKSITKKTYNKFIYKSALELKTLYSIENPNIIENTMVYLEDIYKDLKAGIEFGLIDESNVDTINALQAVSSYHNKYEKYLTAMRSDERSQNYVPHELNEMVAEFANKYLMDKYTSEFTNMGLSKNEAKNKAVELTYNDMANINESGTGRFNGNMLKRTLPDVFWFDKDGNMTQDQAKRDPDRDLQTWNSTSASIHTKHISGFIGDIYNSLGTIEYLSMLPHLQGDKKLNFLKLKKLVMGEFVDSNIINKAIKTDQVKIGQQISFMHNGKRIGGTVEYVDNNIIKLSAPENEEIVAFKTLNEQLKKATNENNYNQIANNILDLLGVKKDVNKKYFDKIIKQVEDKIIKMGIYQKEEVFATQILENGSQRVNGVYLHGKRGIVEAMNNMTQAYRNAIYFEHNVNFDKKDSFFYNFSKAWEVGLTKEYLQLIIGDSNVPMLAKRAMANMALSLYSAGVKNKAEGMQTVAKVIGIRKFLVLFYKSNAMRKTYLSALKSATDSEAYYEKLDKINYAVKHNNQQMLDNLGGLASVVYPLLNKLFSEEQLTGQHNLSTNKHLGYNLGFFQRMINFYHTMKQGLSYHSVKNDITKLKKDRDVAFSKKEYYKVMDLNNQIVDKLSDYRESQYQLVKMLDINDETVRKVYLQSNLYNQALRTNQDLKDIILNTGSDQLQLGIEWMTKYFKDAEKWNIAAIYFMQMAKYQKLVTTDMTFKIGDTDNLNLQLIQKHINDKAEKLIGQTQGLYGMLQRRLSDAQSIGSLWGLFGQFQFTQYKRTKNLIKQLMMIYGTDGTNRGMYEKMKDKELSIERNAVINQLAKELMRASFQISANMVFPGLGGGDITTKLIAGLLYCSITGGGDWDELLLSIFSIMGFGATYLANLAIKGEFNPFSKTRATTIMNKSIDLVSGYKTVKNMKVATSVEDLTSLVNSYTLPVKVLTKQYANKTANIENKKFHNQNVVSKGFDYTRRWMGYNDLRSGFALDNLWRPYADISTGNKFDFMHIGTGKYKK